MSSPRRQAKTYRRAALAIAEGTTDLLSALVDFAPAEGAILDGIDQLAQSLDARPTPNTIRRLSAFAAFADQRATLIALHDLADRLDPVRMPIGYLTINPARHDLINLATRVLVATSAGKDSVVMEDVVCTRAADQEQLHKVIAVHNDLGKTDSGEPVEWPGTEDLARRQTARYGIPFEVTTRDKGGLFQQLTQERKKFPSNSARWCTSDQKTSQAMKVVTRLTTEARDNGADHVVIVYCVGLRAQESAGRARKPEFAIDRSASNRRRTVIRWHPIIHWTARQVWEHIRDRSLEYHWAYDAGMDRLSCRLCVLATAADLVCAARLSPALVDDYAAAEESLGHTFKKDLPIAEIRDEARRLGQITDIQPGAAVERNLADDAPTTPEQLAICAA
jgi:3'-phosphoadenosine 5'-phosphosulfate sulfotransferase (PAPS reductase)/FAD synthetase